MSFQIKVNDTGAEKGAVDPRDEVIVTTSEEVVVAGKTLKEETTYKVSAQEFVLSDVYKSFGDPLDRLTRLTASLGRALHRPNLVATENLMESALAAKGFQDTSGLLMEKMAEGASRMSLQKIWRLAVMPQEEKPEVSEGLLRSLFDHPMVGPLLETHPLLQGMKTFCSKGALE